MSNASYMHYNQYEFDRQIRFSQQLYLLGSYRCPWVAQRRQIIEVFVDNQSLLSIMCPKYFISFFISFKTPKVRRALVEIKHGRHRVVAAGRSRFRKLDTVRETKFRIDKQQRLSEVMSGPAKRYSRYSETCRLMMERSAIIAQRRHKSDRRDPCDRNCIAMGIGTGSRDYCGRCGELAGWFSGERGVSTCCTVRDWRHGRW